MVEAAQSRAAGRVAFAYPSFTRYAAARFFTVIASEMQSVAVGWQVYEITKRPLDLGLVGLAQFAPGVLLFLMSGHAADRYDRRRILLACYSGSALCAALLLSLSWSGLRTVYPIYAVMALVGVVRSFSGSAAQSLVPQLVPREHFPNAVAWGASVFQMAVILGPALGGLIYAAFRHPAAVYLTVLLSCCGGIVALARIQTSPRTGNEKDLSLKTMLAGFAFIWRRQIVLGSISLDMFAVLLGGAVALLPVYARDILHTGPWGLGLLRSAPGVGAAVTAVAHWPLGRRAGATMLWCVAGFGLFTVLFGISHSLFLSLACLAVVGATDMVSVIVRGTLVQLATPDEMRGRVSAVNSLFIGASNELGQAESGLTAQWFGTVPAVVLGGLGTLLITAAWAWRFPELRRAGEPAAGPVRHG
jgi:MFS family permease